MIITVCECTLPREPGNTQHMLVATRRRVEELCFCSGSVCFMWIIEYENISVSKDEVEGSDAQRKGNNGGVIIRDQI